MRRMRFQALLFT